jgi:phosphoribosylaminoimidazole-succinocarboxamide synthase
LKSNKNIVQEENGKKICLCREDQTYIVDYRDEIFLNGISKVRIKNLGQKLSTLNAFFLDYLNAYNIPTGFKRMSNYSLVFQKYTQYPFNIKVLNVIDRRTSRVFGRR